MTEFSYQLYSSRNFGPLGDTLKMLAQHGYKGVEGYGALYADEARVEELRTCLADCGLRMRSGHFSLDMIEGDPGRAIAIARDLGIETIYCPFLPAPERPEDGAGYEAFGKRLQKAGAALRAESLGFGWHNHDFEFVRLKDGAVPQAAIFEGGPDLEWEADVAWVIKGGADPMRWISEFGSRITAVHVKDIAPTGENADQDGWADVGEGIVDWPALMKALRETPARHFVMEHDNPSDDARFAEVSLAAAKLY